MKKTHRQIRLKDGRKLGFAEYGDSKGKPLFFFHGWPSSRFHANTTDAAAKKLNVRVISIDRPGYGLSDFQNDRILLHWPDDVVELADRLKLKKFAVVGVSGGAPYAAVCAFKLSDRITKVGIVVGLAPIDIEGILQEMSFLNKLAWSTYAKFPSLGSFGAYIHYSLAKRMLPDIFSFAYQSKSDRALLTKEVKKDLIRNRAEAFRQGIKGAALDIKIYANDWGFNVKDIKSQVYLWYGDKDKNVSLKMGTYYASQIKNSKLVIYPDEGHFLMKRHAKEILQTITK